MCAVIDAERAVDEAGAHAPHRIPRAANEVRLGVLELEHVTVADIQAVAKPGLRHRIAGNYTAQANNITGDRLIEMLMEAIPADRKYERPAELAAAGAD